MFHKDQTSPWVSNKSQVVMFVLLYLLTRDVMVNRRITGVGGDVGVFPLFFQLIPMEAQLCKLNWTENARSTPVDTHRYESPCGNTIMLIHVDSWQCIIIHHYGTDTESTRITGMLQLAKEYRILWISQQQITLLIRSWGRAGLKTVTKGSHFATFFPARATKFC